jgi:hypothetical protein
MKAEYLPPDDYIEKVKMRQATFSWLVLPDSKYYGPAHAQSNLLRAPTVACFDHPLPDYAILNNETDLAENMDSLPGGSMPCSLYLS